MKWCSAPLIIREMQIKTTMRYCLSGYLLLKRKKQNTTENSKFGKDVEKGDSCALLVGMAIWTATVENSMAFSQKLKNRITIWSSNPTFRYIPKRTEIRFLRRYLYSYVHSSIIYNIYVPSWVSLSEKRNLGPGSWRRFWS